MRRPRLRVLLIAVLCFGLLLCRRPAVLLHADFWAEDGWNWYPDAYNAGGHSLLVPYAGYAQTICRLVALAATPFPLLWAPTIFALAALGIETTAAVLLLSRRLDDVWPRRASRALFAGMALLLPNSFELYGNLTNAQWTLSLIGFLLLVATPARRPLGRALDLAVLSLCGLSGPFCLFLLPVAAWQYAARRGADRGARLFVLTLCAVLQAILALSAGRTTPPLLGASLPRLANIVGLQIVAGTLLGRHRMAWVLGSPLWINHLLPFALCLLAAGLAVIALTRGSLLLRQFCLYAALLFAAGVLRPATGSNLPAWLLFTSPDIGDRYYVIPMLAWLGVLFSLAAQPGLRIVARALIAAVLLAIPGDLHFATGLATAPPTDFDAAARRFAASPLGTHAAFPIHPQGARPMHLVKH
ncbi:hypothetical protein [Lichenicoccus sp.]|uniref:hypothetical protein n=1 Tax=Lichenicoccus sp. TaxID=2781899 RepID=UPI003D13287A